MKEMKKILPYTRQKLADEYGINVKTLNAWFKRVGLEIPEGTICPKTLELIREEIGYPFKTISQEEGANNNK